MSPPLEREFCSWVNILATFCCNLLWGHSAHWSMFCETLQLQTFAQSTMEAVTRMQTVTRRAWLSTVPAMRVTKETASPASPLTGGVSSS